MTERIKQELAVENAKISIIEQQLESINEKLDNLIETVSTNHIENINRYNRLSERITVLEASREQTKYIIGVVAIGLTALEFALKYIF